MRVVQINSICGIRSTGRIVSSIAELLRESGDECLLVYAREEIPESCIPYSYKMESKFEVYSHVLQSRILDNSGFGSTRATKRLIKKLEEYQPDIIHIHNLHGYYIDVRELFGYIKKNNIPTVWTLHDCWSFTGHCSCYEFVSCDKWMSGCEHCIQKREYPASYILDRSKKNYQLKKELFTGVRNLTLVTPSIWLAKECKKSFLGNYIIKVINNGIDLQCFRFTESDKRAKYGIGSKKIVLAVSTDWADGRKGFDDIIKLPSLLGEEYQVVIIGVHGQQMKAVPNGIIAIEKTNSISELAEWYSIADVFINPTYEDNYPTTNLEAIACGTPVITYPSGGSPEIVKGGYGFVTSKKDIVELSHLIPKASEINIIMTDTLKEKLDRNLRFREYIDLYKEMLNNEIKT